MLSLVTTLLNVSSSVITGWMANTRPAVAVADGWVLTTSLLAAAGLTTTLLEVAGVTPLALALKTRVIGSALS